MAITNCAIKAKTVVSSLLLRTCRSRPYTSY